MYSSGIFVDQSPNKYLRVDSQECRTIYAKININNVLNTLKI